MQGVDHLFENNLINPVAGFLLLKVIQPFQRKAMTPNYQ